jgi:hypothetical protein
MCLRNALILANESRCGSATGFVIAHQGERKCTLGKSNWKLVFYPENKRICMF